MTRESQTKLADRGLRVRRHAALLFGGMLFVVACGGRPAPAADDDHKKSALALREEVMALDAHLRKNGLERRGPVFHKKDPSSSTPYHYDLNLGEQRCYTILVAAAKKSSVSLQVTDPAGQVVAPSKNGPEHPWLSFCAKTNGQFRATISVSASSAGIYFGVYESRHTPFDLETYYANRGSKLPASQGDLQLRLSAADKHFLERGFSSAAVPMAYTLAAGQERKFRLKLSKGRCYAFAAFGDGGVVDSDIYLADGNGDAVVSQSGPAGPDSAIEYCATNDGEYRLRAVNFSGQGRVVVAIWQAKAGSAGDLAPTSSTSEVVTAEVSRETFAQRYNSLVRDIKSRGYVVSNTELASFAASTRKSFKRTVKLSGGHCYALAALAENSVRALELRAQVDQQLVDVDDDNEGRAIVRLCPQADTSYQILAKAREGGGKAKIGLYKWPRGIAGPFGLEGVMYVRFAEYMHLLSKENFESDLHFQPQKQTLFKNVATRITFETRPEQCYVILAIGGATIFDLNLSIERAGQPPQRDTTTHATPDIRFCSERAEKIEISVSSKEAGAFFLQAFVRQS